VNSEILALMITSISVAFVHTALGPDHYIPFIVLSKSEHWTKVKTSIITFLCGIGHVGSSIVIGMVGYFIGAELFSLKAIETFSGNIAGWMLIIFGAIYTVWGIQHSYKKKPHTHFHQHFDESPHSHSHTHKDTEHSHVHLNSKKKLTPWIIFIVFVLGPCEPLIPLLLYPAATQNFFAAILVASAFSIVTLGTMQAMVFTGYFGLKFLPIKKIENYIHALAGASILLCGIGIQFLGL